MPAASELVTRLILDQSQFNTGIKQVETRVQRFGSMMPKLIAGLAFGAIGIAAGLAARNLAEMTEKIDDIATRSQKLGITTDAFQKLSYIAKMSDSSLEVVDIGMQKIAASISKAEQGSKIMIETFRKLGLTARDLKNQALDKTYLDIAAAINKIKNPNDQLIAAQSIFGSKAGAAQLQVIRADVEAIGKEYDTLGSKLSGAQIRNASALEDSAKKFKETVSGMANALLTSMSPALTTLITKATQLTTILADGTKAVVQGADSFVGRQLAGVERFIQGVYKQSSRLNMAGLIPGNFRAALGALQDSPKEKGLVSIQASADKAAVGLEKAGLAASEFAEKATDSITNMIDSITSQGISAQLQRVLGPMITEKYSGKEYSSDRLSGFDSSIQEAFKQVTMYGGAASNTINGLLERATREVSSLGSPALMGVIDEVKKYATNRGVSINDVNNKKPEIVLQIVPSKLFDAEILKSSSVISYIKSATKAAIISEVTSAASSVGK